MTTKSVTTIITLAVASVLHADHGPGTSGSGFATQTAETLARGKAAATLSHDWTEFGGLNSQLTPDTEHLDLIDRSNLTTFSISLGVIENLQIGLNIGYYSARGTRRLPHSHGEAESRHDEAEHHEHPAEPHHHHEDSGHHDEEDGHAGEKTKFSEFDADGWTDIWVTAKYRLYRGPAGQFAVIGGVKLPTGETRFFDSAGERVEAASTPGSGAWDGMIGGSYTLQLRPELALDASAQYTFRGEKSGYRLGNRFDAGVAAGWRVMGDDSSRTQLHLLGEISVRHIERSESQGRSEAGTGGTAVFLSPGVRLRVGANASWTVGAQLPIHQDLNEVQVETSHRFSTSFNFAF